MLSAHAILVAVIFSSYMLLMTGLVGWICWTGRPEPRSEDQDDDGQEPDGLLAAA